MDNIKVITVPDIIFDKSKKILLIQPTEDIKKSVESYIADIDQDVSIYYYTHTDQNLKWLFSVLEMTHLAVIDLDSCDQHLSHFLGYILANPHTYYRVKDAKHPWDLINQNRFFDFTEIKQI
jgi:hypothetical protein